MMNHVVNVEIGNGIDPKEVQGSSYGEGRDEKILELRASGYSLEEIGRSYGITRERVRQIVNANGGVPAHEARRIGRMRKEDARANSRREIVDRFDEVIRSLVANDHSSLEIARHIHLFDPSLRLEDVKLAVQEVEPATSRNQEDFRFEILSVEMAYNYVYAKLREISVTPELASTHLSVEQAKDMAEILEGLEFSRTESAEILCGIAATYAELKKGNVLAITGAQYEKFRAEFLESRGIKSRKGNSLWPPTKQTIAKRIGNGRWNDAVQLMGFTPSSKGRTPGPSFYKPEDYTRAMVAFCEYLQGSGLSHTTEQYELWVAKEAKRNVIWPAPASIRNFFGTWQRALRSTGMTVQVRDAAMRPAQYANDAIGAVEKIISDTRQALKSVEKREAVGVMNDAFFEIGKVVEISHRYWMRHFIDHPGLDASALLAVMKVNSTEKLREDRILDGILGKKGVFSFRAIGGVPQLKVSENMEFMELAYRFVRQMRNETAHGPEKLLAIPTWSSLANLDPDFASGATSLRLIQGSLGKSDYRPFFKILRSVKDALSVVADAEKRVYE